MNWNLRYAGEIGGANEKLKQNLNALIDHVLNDHPELGSRLKGGIYQQMNLKSNYPGRTYEYYYVKHLDDHAEGKEHGHDHLGIIDGARNSPSGKRNPVPNVTSSIKESL